MYETNLMQNYPISLAGYEMVYKCVPIEYRFFTYVFETLHS